MAGTSRGPTRGSFLLSHRAVHQMPPVERDAEAGRLAGRALQIEGYDGAVERRAMEGAGCLYGKTDGSDAGCARDGARVCGRRCGCVSVQQLWRLPSGQWSRDEDGSAIEPG